MTIPLIGLGVFLVLQAGCGQSQPPEKKVEALPAHPSFVTAGELGEILSRTKLSHPNESSALPEGRIVAAVVPHHLVAAQLIDRVMATLALQEPERVIVVGPNHPNTASKVITGLYGWQTPEGVMEADSQVVNSLLEKGVAARDEDVLSREHSIGAVVPLLYHYLPHAKIVPVILHHDVSLEDIDQILKALAPFMTEKTVLIASVDFSHYLTRSEAQIKDLETRNYMKYFDYSALLRLGNDHMDSPPSLVTAFRLAENTGIKDFTILDNTNSGIIMQNDFMETTSYFTLLFTEQQ